MTGVTRLRHIAASPGQDPAARKFESNSSASALVVGTIGLTLKRSITPSSFQRYSVQIVDVKVDGGALKIQLRNILLLLITAEANSYGGAICLEIKGGQSFWAFESVVDRSHKVPRWLKQIVIEIKNMDAKIHDDASALCGFGKARARLEGPVSFSPSRWMADLSAPNSPPDMRPFSSRA